ncbi:MAG: ABC transporter permease [Bryobacteraceae bacterium]
MNSDLKFVLRSLGRNPLFVLVAVMSLALGIGANSAIFSLLDQVLLRSLPVRDPQQLVSMDWDGTFSGSSRNDHAFSYPMYVGFRDKSSSIFEGVLARFPSHVDLGWRGTAERANAELVSGNYFDVLGVKTAIGRTLTPDDDKLKGGEPYVVLGYGYWQKRFGGSSSVLNQTVDVNNRPMTVVGVAQHGFRGTEVGSPTDLFVPMMMKPQVTPTWDDMNDRRSIWLNIMARLKPNVSRKQAEAAMTVLYHQEQLEDLKANTDAGPNFRKNFLKNKFILASAAKGFSSMREKFSTALVVLMAMVGTLLLIACGNVANLLVARAATRQREISIRLSLGASKGAIFRLVLIESLLLSLVGGGLGVLVASWTGSLLLRFLPFENVGQVFSTSPDRRVLLFTLASSVLTAVIFGSLPALQIAKPNVVSMLKNEAASVIGGSHVKLRKALVAAQISLSLLLLIGAGLFARSLYNLMQVNSGMRTAHVLSFSVDPSLAGYSAEHARQLFRKLQEALRAAPGAQAVSGSEVPILATDNWSSTTRAEGYNAKQGEDLNPDVNGVLPTFFSTMGVPFVAGREFAERDSFGAPKVAIVNESFVKSFFRDRNPIGRHIGFGSPHAAKLDIEIVGVVKDVKAVDLKRKSTRQVWLPALQEEHPAGLTFYIRTENDPQSVARLARRTVRRIDPALPVYSMKTVETQIRETHYIDRLITMLSAAFGLLATLLAAVGLYGVMAFTVARRTRELGIRMALGAQRASVVRLVMQDVILLAGIGIGAALPLAFGLGRFIESQLFGLKATDPSTLIAATLLLVTVALSAGYIPAVRATRIDPMDALRWE